MDPRAVDQSIQMALQKKFLSLRALDDLLSDDASFDENLAKLNAHLIDAYQVEIPSLDGSHHGLHPPSHQKGLGGTSPRDTLHGYLSTLAGKPRMRREDEYRYAKRMEFFTDRLIKTIRTLNLSPEREAFFLENRSCPGFPGSASACPACETLGKCPRGKEGPIHTLCKGYNMCRSVFVERNLHLVVELIQPYRSYPIPVMDLIQEGNAALIRSVEKFDWRKQVRLQTYAEYWVRQAVERLIGSAKGIVRVPNHIQQKMRRVKREGKLPLDQSRLSSREVSKAMDLSDTVARHLLESERRPVSLDATLSQDGTMQLADLIPDAPEDVLHSQDFAALRQGLRGALDGLTPQETAIVKHRFGMDGAEAKTLAELGEMIGVSGERIRRILLRTLQKLKKHDSLKKFQSFLDSQ